jgi:hypothetical protein
MFNVATLVVFFAFEVPCLRAEISHRVLRDSNRLTHEGDEKRNIVTLIQRNGDEERSLDCEGERHSPLV